MSQTPKPPTDPTTANPNPSPNPKPDIGNEGQPDNVPPFGKQVTMADGFVITGQPDVTRADVQVRDIHDVIDQFAGDLKIYCTQPDTLHMAPGLERRFHGLILPRAGIDINHPPLRRPVNAETPEVAARAVITTARTVPGGGSMRINADAMERDVAQAGFRRALLTEMEWPAEIVRYNLADTEQRVF